ncbi:helix-turn-helix domain-containing protein [Carboxylicivirga sp. RSCT41]|uniref:helix-turn-helix domain-containing protein n=1 Tax=Carboxylicivirga agarovorans TaxID=3417570 RepID=UPI003D33D0ED
MAEIIISSSSKEITKIIRKELQILFRENGFDSRVLNDNKENRKNSLPKERVSQLEACKIIGISLPTLYKEIRRGKFKQYSVGRNKYLLRSEIIEALKK